MYLTSWMGNLGPQEGLARINDYIAMLTASNSETSTTTVVGWMEFMLKKNFRKAEEYLKRAIEEDAADTEAKYFYGYMLNMLGRHDEALQITLQARQLDPVSVPGYNYLGVTHYLSGNFDEAESVFKEANRIHPLTLREYDHLAKVYLATGKIDLVEQTIETALLLSKHRPPSMLTYLALSHHFRNDREKSRRIISELIERVIRQEKGINIYLAQYYAVLDNLDEAFHWLGKSMETRDVDLIWLKRDPLFRNLAGDPRYEEALKKVGF